MAIQRARYQPRRRRLADAARPGKKISMVQTIVGDRVLQRLRQDFLARYVFKFLRTPLTGDYLIGHLFVVSSLPEQSSPILVWETF